VTVDGGEMRTRKVKKLHFESYHPMISRSFCDVRALRVD